MRKIRARCVTVVVWVMACAPASATEIQAGPIWNNDDARGKCPVVCARNGKMGWTGQWRTMVEGVMSVCDCVAGAAPPMPGQGSMKTFGGTHFPGNDLGGSIHATSADACAELCLRDGRCGAFTFNTPNSKC